MKKKLLIALLTIVSIMNLRAQSVIDTTLRKPKDTIAVTADFAIYSANYCRGANFGQGPSAQVTLQAEYKGFYLGAWSAITGNGKYNYGNNLDVFVGKKIGGFSVSIHDFFFFNKENKYNAFFKRNAGIDTLDGHYLEGQVKYTRPRWYIMAAYNFYATQMEIFPSTVYIEGEYAITEHISLSASFQTGASAVNFYGNTFNKGIGFNYIGFNFNKPIEVSNKFTPILRASLHLNPNYENISSSLRSAPFNCVVGFTF